MTHLTEEQIEDLKAENLELKLGALKKEMTSIKTDLHRHMDLVLETTKDRLDIIQSNTEKTNGSVARAMQQIAAIERQDTKTKIDELTLELKEYKKQTKFWALIGANKWVAALIGVSLYALTYQEIRTTITQVFKILF